MLVFALSAAVAGTLSDAVASGDCDTLIARTEPFEAQVEIWRVPRAWCHLKLGDADTANAMLYQLPEGVLGDYGRLVQARARVKLGDLQGAERSLDGLSLPGDAGDEVRLTRAELMAKRGDVSGLRKILASLGAEELGGILLGDAQLQAEDPIAAEKTWRGVWTAARVGGFDTMAAERLAGMGAESFTPAERNARLASLRTHKRIDEAAELAGQLSDSGEAASPVQLARVNLSARNYTEALEQWGLALGKPEEATGSAALLFDYALTYARTGDYTTAAVVYKRVMAQHPKDPKAVLASYKLGYMAYDANDCVAAVPLFEDHAKNHPTSRHLDEALWFTARCQWRLKQGEAAVKSWEKLRKERGSSELVPGAVYWLARAKGEGGDAEGEKAALEGLIERYPVSGYAWFAAQRLGRTFPAVEPVERPAWPDALAKRADVVRAETLLEVGFRDWARGELEGVEKALVGREAQLAGAWAFIAVGDYRKGRELARPHCNSPWKGGDPIAQQACTPRVEPGIVSRVAERFDLDPLVPYGIMTAESALKPWVTSFAGARGLMQMMPKEGPRVHAHLYPERPFDADDLYSAPYNASMGTAELGLRRQSLQGVLEGTDMPAVVASYNGGEEAVRRWLTAYESPPPFDEFAEDIGYTETRKYVKTVLGFVMAYRWTYGDVPKAP